MTKEDELIAAFEEISKMTGGSNKHLKRVVDLINENWRSEVFPSVMTGWLLLQRSGLNQSEKATVLATTGLRAQQLASGSALDLAAVEASL